MSDTPLIRRASGGTGAELARVHAARGGDPLMRRN
jgi:hypothetical protein